MNETIKKLNELMNTFYKHWEKDNTNEMFILLNGSNDTTEIKMGVERNNKRLDEIESIINDESNFKSLIENWELIDLKMLDSLVDSFEIDVESFKERLKDTEANNNIKEFFN